MSCETDSSSTADWIDAFNASTRTQIQLPHALIRSANVSVPLMAMIPLERKPGTEWREPDAVVEDLPIGQNLKIQDAKYAYYSPELVSRWIKLNFDETAWRFQFSSDASNANYVPEYTPTIGALGRDTALRASDDRASAILSFLLAFKRAGIARIQSVAQSLKAKADAVSRLKALVDEFKTDETITIHPCAVSTAERFLRALPQGVALPEFSVEPDGSISLDWMESRNRLFSISVGQNDRFACAWLDGTNKGHFVEKFDGQKIPKRIIDGITAIVK
jgi:hypothetical protein